MGFLGFYAKLTYSTIMAAAAHSPEWPCTFFVATTGSDASNGTTLGSPFRTLGRAQNALRALPRPLETRALACVRGGTYAESLSLSDADGGSASGAESGFIAYAGEEAVVSGSVAVSFSPVNPTDPGWVFLPPAVRGSVVVTYLNVTDFGDWQVQGGFAGCKGPPLELLYNGSAQEPARWPNREPGAWGGPYTMTVPSWDSAPDALVANTSDPFWEWADTTDLWLHGYWWWDWNDVFIKPSPRSDWNASSGRIPLVAGPGVTNVSGAARFYALNSLSALDVAGEYFLNRSSGALYWLPPPGTPPNSPGAAVSVGGARTYTVQLDGGPLSHFALVGLSFWGARGSAVSISGTGTGILLVNLTVTHAGLGGLDVYGFDDVLVQGCTVSGTGSSGITVGGPDDRLALVSSERRVTDNTVHDFERVCFTYAPGIGVMGTGAFVARNEVYNSAHYGMTIHGNNLLFTQNILHHLTMDTFDNAALYFEPSDWTVWNMTILNNFGYLNGFNPTPCNFRTSCLRGTFYMDNVGAGLNVIGNVVWMPEPTPLPTDEWHPTAPAWVAVNNDGGSHTLIANNIFVDMRNASSNSGGGLAWESFGQQSNASEYYADMRAVNWSTPGSVFEGAYPSLAALQDFFSADPPCAENPACPAAPWGNAIARNVAWNVSAMLYPPVPGAQFPASNFNVTNNLIGIDPRFVSSDPRADLDFRLRPDSPAYTMLDPPFQEIPWCFGPWAICTT